ncbi:uncharacterized protein LOC143145664 [Ptiloglossa arizonensis]|uniref:uncharacterized protein LOC143145664 n=1 Tax=Ptiloglossa arizonensis TaxID=3350558 RepID=UPI003FA13931
MAAPQASSRLELLQARFQQKQLQEKEQKLLQLYDQQQQRAYQVVQRGSAGSNGSSHGSTVSQHTVTKTSTSSHTTSTSQGGKVRQMFDERRQTTVKGIDRSYPLEPLENKPRKQTNGNAVQKNGNLTVNRHSVTVKRVARADVNSNLNGGKPVVSYHEEITRESFGPSGRQQPDDDEFGNENHVAQYANGNHRDETHIEEVLDEDTIERNRMMAKLHLMEYDETLKHRVKNDLESEEFPEDFMVDVPDKLPKQSVTKKLSQAEARLERFRNANAKRNSKITKNTSTIGVPTKRFDPIFPAKSTSSENKAVKSRTKRILDDGSCIGGKDPRGGVSKEATVTTASVKEILSSSASERVIGRSDNTRYFCKKSKKSVATTRAIHSDNVGGVSPDFSKCRKRRSESPKYLCKEVEKSTTTYPIDAKAVGRLSPDFSKNRPRRGGSPKYFGEESKISNAIESKRERQNGSPMFHRKETETSATAYAIDSKTDRKYPTEVTSDVKRTMENVAPKRSKYWSVEHRDNVTGRSAKSETVGIDTVDRDIVSPEPGIVKRTSSPDSLQTRYKEDRINSKPIRQRSLTVFERLTRQRSPSPKFFLGETEGTASTMGIGTKRPDSTSKSPDFVEKIGKERSASPRALHQKHVHQVIRTVAPKSPDFAKRTFRKSSTSPHFFSRDADRSATIMLVTPETITKVRTGSTTTDKKERRSRSSMDRSNIAATNKIRESNRRMSKEDTDQSSKYHIRSSVSRFFSEQCEKASRNMDDSAGDSVEWRQTDRNSDVSRSSSPMSLKNMKTVTQTSRSPSLCRDKTGKPTTIAGNNYSKPLLRSRKMVDSGTKSPEFFCYETKTSATTMSLKPKSKTDSTIERSKSPRSRSNSSTSAQSGGRSSKSPDNFTVPKDVEVIGDIDRWKSRESSPKSRKMVDSGIKSPEFFCYETKKSATTMSLKPKSKTDSTIERSKSPRSRSNSSTSAQSGGRSSKSPDNFTIPKDVEVIGDIDRWKSRESSPRSRKMVDSRTKSPEFFCYETKTSATTINLKSKSLTKGRSESPRSRPSSSTSVPPGSRTSKSSAVFTVSKDTKASDDIYKSSSRDSLRTQKLMDNRNRTPEYFCYETKMSATTVSLKPKSKTDSTDERSGSPRSRPSSSESRSSKSPDVYTRLTNTSSPRLQKIVNTRRGTPDFYCYETDKSATTVGLESKFVKDWSDERSKSPRSRPSSSTGIQAKDRSAKSPDMSKNAKVTVRRGSGNVLRSTKLIRDIMKHQKDRSQIDRTSEKDARNLRRCSIASENGKGISSVDDAILKHSTEELESNRNVDERATKSPTRMYEHPVPESSPKSSISVEVDAEIREITMPDQYVKLEKPQRGQLRGTYSRTSNKMSQGSVKSKTENTSTYSVRKPGKKRGSLFESDIFEPSRKHQQTYHRGVSGSIGNSDFSRRGKEKGVDLKHIVRNTSNISCSSSPSPTSESTFRAKKRQTAENTTLEKSQTKASKQRTPSPVHLKEKPRRQPQVLGSIELVRNIMRGAYTVEEVTRKNLCETTTPVKVENKHEILESRTEVERSDSVVSRAIEFIKYDEESSSRNYERTDSVESALRRFDSIDTEPGAASAQSTLERSKESATERRQTLSESSRIEGSTGSSRTISLKALNRGNVNSPSTSPENKPSRTSLKKISTGRAPEVAGTPCETRAPETQETRRRKKLAKARDSIEIARVVARSKSPGCRRKLFKDTDSREETDTGDSKWKRGLESTRTAGRVQSRTTKGKRDTSDSVKLTSKFAKPAAGDGTSIKKASKEKTSEAPTGASNLDHSMSVKQLRSIEDIRKSIENESTRGRGTTETWSRSAIANNARDRVNGDVHVARKKVTSLSKRSENLSGRGDVLGDSGRFVKCATRFSRVAKSPSPDSTKATETSSRTRRNVPPSPSKSPDTVTRRPSTDLKAQDTKSTKRPAPMKGTEPIGNRKTTTTTTTRKSTDVVDGAILENGLHLRDQTAETKYDNDSPTTKKSDAFVIDFDEQPPKENDGSLPRKPLLRKQSTEKHTPSTQSGRPPSSVSSTSSGSTMQGHVSGTKSRLATKSHTPTSATLTFKGSASGKAGGNVCATDLLVPCKMCGRRFAQDRVTLHEQICAKTGQKKRKQFDTVMFRVKGTELERFVKKGHNKKQLEKPAEVKTNWRRKHEDFINAIRSAKQVQAHLAAGGKLSDLPPPPVSDTSDYIQCPHCGRKFNKPAAERHIPKCEHMLHNKPVHSRAPKPRR